MYTASKCRLFGALPHLLRTPPCLKYKNSCNLLMYIYIYIAIGLTI